MRKRLLCAVAIAGLVVSIAFPHIPVLAEKALVDPCTGGNPREVSLADLEELFRKAF